MIFEMIHVNNAVLKLLCTSSQALCWLENQMKNYGLHMDCSQ